MADDEVLEASLRNVVDQKTLRWVFVGGKGGVGKTTTSCSLAAQLSKTRKSVLLVSTDPAHNLSDAFGQKFSPVPTKVEGFDNLFAMESDATQEVSEGASAVGLGGVELPANMMMNVPGIDEALTFAKLMKFVMSMEHDVIVFDTAPTGHTLRLLNFPHVLQSALVKLSALKGKVMPLMNQLGGMVAMPPEDELERMLESLKTTVEKVIDQFRDADLTTFVSVCIPEFLSLYETERLVQELAKGGIDARNIVVNQILVPDANVACKQCAARVKMQQKYLRQIDELYADDFHVTRMPQLTEEVRGHARILSFSENLVDPHPNLMQSSS